MTVSLFAGGFSGSICGGDEEIKPLFSAIKKLHHSAPVAAIYRQIARRFQMGGVFLHCLIFIALLIFLTAESAEIKEEDEKGIFLTIYKN